MYTDRHKIFLLLIILSCINLNGYSQYFLYQKINAQDIDVSFQKKSIETESNQSFFNVIKVKNKGSKTEELTLNITVPSGWKVIGQEKLLINLNPLDSLLIPIRVSVHGRVKGDIGYSIVASLADNIGNTIKNEYCFIKIKRKEDVRISIPIGFNYFDQKTGLSEFSVKVTNNGNKEELINFIFETDKGMTFGDSQLENYSQDLTIPPFTDTTFNYFVKIKDDNIVGKENYRLSFRAISHSKSYSKTLWFRILKSEYLNFLSATDKILTLELMAQGLMNENKSPNYVLTASGKTLLKNNNNIYYYYRNLSSRREEDLYLYNRMYLGTSIKEWNIEIGDNNYSHESSLVGRGISITLKNKIIPTKVIANKNQRNETENVGVITGIQVGKSNSIDLGFIYNKDKQREIESIIGTFGTKFKIKYHSFSLLGAINPIKRNINDKNKQFEYSGEVRYGSTINRLMSDLRIRYGTPLYYGIYKGRLTGTLNSYYTINNTHKILLNAIINDNKSPNIQNNNLQYYNINNNLNLRLFHRWEISPKISAFYGPSYERYSKNHVSGTNVYKNYFESSISSIQMGSKFKFEDPNTSLTPKITIGNVHIIDFPLIYGDNIGLYDGERNFVIYYFDLNFRSKKWSLITSYESGPKNIYTQFNYFYISRTTQNLRIMPTFSAFIYKNVINLEASLSYNNDMVLKNSHINTSILFTCFLPNDWSVKANAYYSVNNRNTNSGIEKYNNLYIEAGVKKEFNIAHPRVSFHDLKITIFKDFNGNRIQDANEPGLKDVLVTISKEQTSLSEMIPGDINSVDLLSNYIGKVDFLNIPNGLYKIEYNPIGNDAGTFSKTIESVTINLNKDQEIFIPFTEKNKVFGKIVLNRSRLSGLGKVDVSNIRITATDSKGNTFSTLTDKNGEFTIFAPITDEYIVNINNIFYENFDLRQNNFRVQFNGYKQFEVNFVFDEKIRRINFSPSTQDNLAEGVLQIRRTNLRGTIKDATSLKPLRARINLVNTKNNSIASSVYSNPQTGDYALSFMAEDIYVLEILADDYWYFSENLTLNQVTTFMNVNKDILLKQITIGSKIELNIKFLEINKAALGPETVAELNRLLRILRDNSNIKIEVQGHCDDLEALNNPQIAEERAKAVAKYLIENGFNNLQVRGFGNTVPIAPNDTEENRTLNRRVELEVISK